ncbi:MAG: SRPBCC family protein [Acidimicrobiales bacterium]
MNPITHPDTSIVADADLPMIRLTREFDATPDKVFRAHTDPDLYARWVGPHDLVTTIDRWDCRTGGNWAFSQRRDGEEYHFYGCFHEVRPGELIVQTFTFAGFPDGVSLERLTLEDLGDGRTRLVATSLVDSFEGRDAMIASGMEGGVRDGYEKLDELLVSADVWRPGLTA